MSNSELRIKLIEELQRIPDDKLTQLYDLIHHFWVESETSDRSNAERSVKTLRSSAEC